MSAGLNTQAGMLRGVIGGGDFSPLDLVPNLWLDADDQSTLFDFSGDPITSDSPLGLWLDKSGLSNNAFQIQSLSRCPLTEESSVNGKRSIRFNNAGSFPHWMGYTAPIFSALGASTVFAVTSEIVLVANNYGSIISAYDQAGKSIGCQPAQFPSLNFNPSTDVFGPGGVSYGTNTNSPSDTHYIMWQWDNWLTHKTNGLTDIAIDGTSGASTPYGGNPNSFDPNAAVKSIGTFDRRSNGSLSGLISEIIVVPRVITAQERANTESYLAQKWGI